MERTKKQLKKNKFLAGSLALVFLIAGSAITTPAAVPPDTKHTDVKPEAKSEATPVPMHEYRYDSKGKTDPFKPFVRLELPNPTAKKGLEKGKHAGALGPLQQVSLDKVRVTGIAGSTAKRVAMVEDGAGKGYIVYQGTRIGSNGGKVIQILSDRVIVEEAIEDFKGKNRSHRVALKLHKEEGEGRP